MRKQNLVKWRWFILAKTNILVAGTTQVLHFSLFNLISKLPISTLNEFSPEGTKIELMKPLVKHLWPMIFDPISNFFMYNEQDSGWFGQEGCRSRWISSNCNRQCLSTVFSRDFPQDLVVMSEIFLTERCKAHPWNHWRQTNYTQASEVKHIATKCNAQLALIQIKTLWSTESKFETLIYALFFVYTKPWHSNLSPQFPNKI